MSRYITAAQVAVMPGKLASLWNGLSATAQLTWIEEASARVDAITGQANGLMASAVTTLSSPATIGATTISTPVALPLSQVVLDMPPTQELVTVAAVTGTGPFVATLSQPLVWTPPVPNGLWSGLQYAHASGSLVQPASTYTYTSDRDTDHVFLPNKPITGVFGILDQPPDLPQYTLPVTPNVYVYLSGGSSFRYVQVSNQIPTTYVPYFDRGYYPFLSGDQITVTYTSGYQSVPPAVRSATRSILGVMLMMILDNPGGADMIGRDGAHIAFGTRSLLNPVMSDVEDALLPYAIKVAL